MDVTRTLLLVAAGLGGGLAGSVAGLASLVSYPALLAFGLGPVAANVTNTVALVFGGAGSTLGSRPELVGQRATVERLAAAGAVGGLAGAGLLLATPSGAFALAVPWLIALASVAILVRPRRLTAPVIDTPPVVDTPPVAGREPVASIPPVAGRGAVTRGAVTGGPVARATTWRLTAVTFAVAVYGGYFGAAAGVLLLAALLAGLGQGVLRANAVKNVVLGVANAVAAVAFIALGPVHWAEAVPLAVGFLGGGRLGPVVARLLPAGALRALIALAGLGLAVHLGLAAYG